MENYTHFYTATNSVPTPGTQFSVQVLFQIPRQKEVWRSPGKKSYKSRSESFPLSETERGIHSYVLQWKLHKGDECFYICFPYTPEDAGSEMNDPSQELLGSHCSWGCCTWTESHAIAKLYPTSTSSNSIYICCSWMTRQASITCNSWPPGSIWLRIPWETTKQTGCIGQFSMLWESFNVLGIHVFNSSIFFFLCWIWLSFFENKSIDGTELTRNQVIHIDTLLTAFKACLP